MIEVTDLIILGRDTANQLSDQIVNQSDQDLYAILSHTPIIFMHKYGELSGLQASFFCEILAIASNIAKESNS
jgi:hypothetical protein